MKSKISITIDHKTLKDIDSIIDNIYIRNRSQAIEFLVNQSLGENKTAVILAGGEPRRMKISKDEYRTTAKIGKGTLVESTVKKLKKNGFKEIFIIAREEILTATFNILKDGTDFGVHINYVEEKESRGSAESLKLARGKIAKTFLVVYSDIYLEKINLEALWNDHLKLSGLATLMLTTTPTPSKKGIVRVEGSKILEFEQKPSESETHLGFSSVFVAEPEMLEQRGHSLEEDIFPKIASNGLLYGHLSSVKEIHIHKKEDLKKINLR